MTYEELKKIAQPHIREGEILPSNSLLLLCQLHIPYKTDKQCEQDFEGKINPLKTNPAFMFIDSRGDKTVYFSSNTQYWNFYIFHEIGHYLLGHEQSSPQNELDADMLACILIAPVENLPSYLKSARDLSSLCKIPIDKAEMYWQEIKDHLLKPHKKQWIIGSMISIFTICLVILITLKINFNNIYTAKEENTTSIVSDIPIQNSSDENPNETIDSESSDTFYITSSGTRYHKPDCQYVKYKTNITAINLSEIELLNLTPCKKCMN